MSISTASPQLKRINNPNTRVSEIVCVPGRNRQAILLSRRRDETVLNRHRFAFAPEIGEQFGPYRRSRGVDINHVQMTDAGREPIKKPFAAATCG